MSAIPTAPTVDPRVFVRLVLMLLALATTSPFAPWVAACAGLVGPSQSLLLLGGLLSGFLAGLFGIGGALVTLPALYAALPGLGVPVEEVPRVAVATALVAMMPTTVVAAWRQHVRGALDVATLTPMIAPMTTGAVGGALLASTLNGPVLAVLFAVQAIFYGSRLVVVRSGDAAQSFGCVARRIGRAPCWIAAPSVAAFCACVGMGGGSMVAPYLQQRFQLPFRHAVATASALNLCIAMGGSLAFFLVARGEAAGPASAHVPAAILLAGGAVAAVSLGVAAAHRLPTALFRRAVGGINLIAAFILILQVAHAA